MDLVIWSEKRKWVFLGSDCYLLIFYYFLFDCFYFGSSLWMLSLPLPYPQKLFQIKEIVKVREFKEMKKTRSKNDKEVDQHVVFLTVDQSNLLGWAVAGWKLLIYCHNY